MRPKRLDIENRQKFFARLSGKVPEHEIKLIDFAYDLAKYGHRRQFRDNGERYFEHCRETALILTDELGIHDSKMIIAALLHDIIEDSFLLTFERIALIFGDDVAYLVQTLTKPKRSDARFKSNDERHEFYFQQVRQGDSRVKILKLCDRLHNIRTLSQCAPAKRERKIRETEEVYLPLIADIIAVSGQIDPTASVLLYLLISALEKLH